jgi:hypothetical protein
VLVLLMREIYHVRHSDGLKRQDIYIQSFRKIIIGVQAILKLYLRNMKGFNIIITYGRDL